MRREPVIVLDVKCGHGALNSRRHAKAARTVSLSQSERGVGGAQACKLAAENETASALFGRGVCQDVPGIIAADRNLVLFSNPFDGVVNLPRVGVLRAA